MVLSSGDKSPTSLLSFLRRHTYRGLVGSPCLGSPASLCCGGRRGPAVSFRGVQSDLSGYSHDTVFYQIFFLY